MTCKAFIMAAISADGFIGKSTDHLSFEWTSKEDKERFKKITKQAGVVIMGHNTFKTINKPLNDRLTIVYSRTKKSSESKFIQYTEKHPQELLEELSNKGYNNVAICGGASIYNLFLKSGCVDKIYLTIEPVLFGAGINLFIEKCEKNLSLLSLSQSENGALFCEYAVVA